MGLRIRTRNLGGFPVEAFYSEFTDEPSMTIQSGLSYAGKRARELEGHGYYQRPPMWGRKLCMSARTEEQVDYGTIRALRRVVDDMEPGWVDAVKDACRIANDPRIIAAWCELPLQVVVAILAQLEARGDLTPCEV
jgi:hypothetical protein